MKRTSMIFLACMFGGCLIGEDGEDELATTEQETHSWGGYHWGRTGTPFTLKLGDNVSSAWDSYLATTSSDWSVSTVLDTTIVGGATRPKPCQATAGQVEVCATRYGRNGWLGLAQVWTQDSHITGATVKVNDTYFATTTYNTPAWRNLVMCQEVGHTLGLDHQDEVLDNPPLNTCMDYSSVPEPNQHPNTHDYDQLELIYNHLDSTTTVRADTGLAEPVGESPSEWGQRVRVSEDGHQTVYVHERGAGRSVVTFVTWVEPQ